MLLTELVAALAITVLIFSTSILNHVNLWANQEVSDLSIAAVGDWGCNSNTSKTIVDIVKSHPDLVIGLGDNSYEPTGNCWLNMIKPLQQKFILPLGTMTLLLN
jgi:hypothetical protein